MNTDTWTITCPDGRTRSWFDDEGFALLSDWWVAASWHRQYSYQFKWLGRPIIQLPTDIVMMQDLIFRIKPTLIIETGIAHGGSAILHASLLRMIHGEADPNGDRPHVVAIDIEIRPHNRKALDAHPLRPMLTLIEGDSTSHETVSQARSAMKADDIVMVVLDSNHLRDHVLKELEAYAPMVSSGSAIVVMDGVMQRLAGLPKAHADWRMDNPISAIEGFRQSPLGMQFSIDRTYDGYACTHSPGGILLRDKGA